MASQPESSVTFGIAHAWLGKSFRRAEAAAGSPLDTLETVFELTYSDQLTKNIRLQPDIQYVRHPSGAGKSRNALVVGLRINIGV